VDEEAALLGKLKREFFMLVLIFILAQRIYLMLMQIMSKNT